MHFSASATSFELKLLASYESCFFLKPEDRSTRFRGVQHSLLDLAFLKDRPISTNLPIRTHWETLIIGALSSLWPHHLLH